MAEKTVKALPLVPQQYDPVNESINRRTIEQAIQDVNSEIGHVKDMQESGISKAVKRHIFLLMGASHCCFNGGSISMMLTALSGIKLPDNEKIFFGDGNDLEIFHDSSDSYIQNATGNIEIRNNTNDGDINFRSDNGSGGLTTYFAIDGGGVYNRFYKNAYFTDDVKALFGNSSDLEIYHDGSNSYIKDVGTGNLRLRGTDLRLESSSLAHNFIVCTEGGSVTAYHNDSSKFSTTATGINVTGTIIGDGLDLYDNEKIRLGASQDLEIYHSGSDSWIHDNGTGNLNIKSNGTFINFLDGSNTLMAYMVPGGAVGLYHNTSAKLATSSSGVNVTGGVNASSHFEISGTTVINSSREITSSNISATGRIKANDGLFQSYVGNLTHREYVVQTSSGGGDFLLGQIEAGGGADGAVTGCVYFAYDYGTTTESPKIHFSFHQRSGTARGNWWYENDDDAAGSNNVKVVLIDDGSGDMFVWLRVGDYSRIKITTEWHHGGNIVNSGQLSASTITTGTTLFDTSNDPTSEHHIGKLFAHDNVTVQGDGKEIFLKSADHNVARIIPRGTGSNLDKGLLSLFDTGTEDVRIDTAGSSWFLGGSIGIGTTSPDAPLTIHNSSDPEIRVGYNSSQDHRITWDSAKLFLDADPDNANGNSILGFRVDGTERLRIQNTGGISFNGDTAAANALDDYEEGTFTLTTAGDSSGAFNGTPSCHYTKIGNMVTVLIAFRVGTNFSSNLVGGLPFTTSHSGMQSSFINTGQAITSTSNTISTTAGNSGTTIRLHNNQSTGDSHNPNTTAEYYRLNFTYKAA